MVREHILQQESTCSMVREHVLLQENTFCDKRTHSVVRRCVLKRTHSVVRRSVLCRHEPVPGGTMGVFRVRAQVRGGQIRCLQVLFGSFDQMLLQFGAEFDQVRQVRSQIRYIMSEVRLGTVGQELDQAPEFRLDAVEVWCRVRLGSDRVWIGGLDQAPSGFRLGLDQMPSVLGQGGQLRYRQGSDQGVRLDQFTDKVQIGVQIRWRQGLERTRGTRR